MRADLPSGYEQVSPHHFRERVGRYYDEFAVGEIIEHRPGRTVTEMDNVSMSSLSMNDSPLHLDAAYCAQTQWGRPLVSSLVTLSIVSGMAARSISGNAIANLGWENIRLPSPVFAGDTLYAKTEITASGIQPAGAQHTVVLEQHAHIEAYVADRWSWLTDDGRYSVVIEQYTPNSVPLYAEYEVDASNIRLLGDGQMLMEPVFAGQIVPAIGLTDEERKRLHEEGRRLCAPFQAMGYRGIIATTPI
ncbi:MaoC family dehydratase [Streptomyces sp. NPDC101151]|uniref:MaoC family dehydratase n=1 Tax=Streptomyces sp. NPDC101151 TaxID=3366115 RepID=UPI00380B142A